MRAADGKLIHNFPPPYLERGTVLLRLLKRLLLLNAPSNKRTYASYVNRYLHMFQPSRYDRETPISNVSSRSPDSHKCKNKFSAS